MKIAQLVWPENSMPPKGYGPVQLVASILANGLSERGHDITSFTTADSTVSGKKIVVAKGPTRDDPTIPDPLYYHSVTMAELLKHKDEFDIIHSHIGHSIIPILEVTDTPVVITSHGNYDNPHPRYIYEKYAQKAHFVAISQSQKKSLPGVNYVGVIYHGVDVESFEFSEDAEDYMLYVGRTSPVKGLAPAIQASIATGRKLKIAAHTDETEAGKKYYDKEIKPYLDREEIEFLGEVPQDELRTLMSKAKLLLFPTQWEEPFGLVVAEANSCGTPVVAFARGAMPEIINDGENGFVAKPDDLEDLCAMIKKVYAMSQDESRSLRSSSRSYAQREFSIKKMIDGYEEVYNKVLKGSKLK